MFRSHEFHRRRELVVLGSQRSPEPAGDQGGEAIESGIGHGTGRLADLLFRETTTIGVRFHEMARECLERETVPVSTPWGEVGVKVARRGTAVFNAQPEFDDLAKLSAERGIPIKDVQALAQKAWLER